MNVMFEQVRRAADVWSVCRWIYLASPVFQRQFYRLGGLDVCSRLMTMLIQKLTSHTTDGKAKKKSDGKDKTHSDSSSATALSPTSIPTPVQTGLIGWFLFHNIKKYKYTIGFRTGREYIIYIYIY